MSRLLFACSLLAVAGCASSDQSALFTPYTDDQFRDWDATGTAILKGQAFVRLSDGRLLTCAGSEVSLKPATGYNMEMEENLDAGKGFPVNYNKRATKYDHKAVCDGSGYFVFEHLPTQTNWIILTHIAWEEPSDIPFMPADVKGGALLQEVLLQPGENRTVLSNQDLAKNSE